MLGEWVRVRPSKSSLQRRFRSIVMRPALASRWLRVPSRPGGGGVEGGPGARGEACEKGAALLATVHPFW